MTITDQPTRIDFELVTVDLYRDIHKGIRTQLFAVTGQAGRLDPSGYNGRVALAEQVRTLADMLVAHAQHEDAGVQPALEVHLPDLAEKIAADHQVIEGRIELLRDMAATAVDARRGAGELVHRLYLELASFTGAYLEHQDVEERVVMPALEAAIGIEAGAAIHQSIVSSIQPDELAQSLAVMLPAMNIDNRAELLGGMRASAPAEVFEGVWGLAGSVLDAPDHAALAARMGVS